jgi:hypothetical protein
MNCPNCGRPSEEGMSFCAACGTMLSRPVSEGTVPGTRMCMTCGRTIPAEYNICPFCGTNNAFVQPTTYKEPLGGIKYVAYIVAFLIPIIGVIWGIVWAVGTDQEKKSAGFVMIIISILGWVLNFILLSALLSAAY